MGFKRDVTECAVNPELGRKLLERTSSPRKILVVGAGASGLEAARVLKLRGHEVTVIEKSDHIGGKLDLAAAAPHKDEFLNLVRYFEFEMKHLGIPVKTNTAIEDFALEGYDGVIVAAGSYPRRISIRGEENVDVYMAHDVLLKKVRPEGPVVILGAGLVGGETADLLIEDGVEVSLVDLVAKPFADMGATLKWVMTGRLRKAKVKMFMESTIVEISKGQVHIKHDTTADVADGEVVISRDDPLTVVPAKSVIIAAGYISDDSMIDRIKRARLPYIRTGDAIRSRNLRDAVLEGYKAATEWVDGI
jgi:NADPH-dependent 2,4-dienoyl-CoA reductase/sulfur reductase-like enzyme